MSDTTELVKRIGTDGTNYYFYFSLYGYKYNTNINNMFHL